MGTLGLRSGFRLAVTCFLLGALGCGPDEEQRPKPVVDDEDVDVLIGVELSPAAPTRTDSIEAVVSYGDGVEPADVTVSYAWFLDESLASNEAVFPGSTAVLGQSIYLVVEAEDDSVTSETVVIVNTPPEVSSIVISPDAPYTNDTVSVSVETSDVDDQAVSVLSYDWLVNDVSMGVFDQTTLNGVFNFDSGDLVSVEVTVTDGVDETVAISDSVEILSTSPTAPVVDLGDDEIRPGDDLICEVVIEATDIDTTEPASYTFTWFRDAFEYTGSVSTTNLPGDTLPSVATSNDEVWTCVATATIDGEQVSAEDSATIVNLRPEDAPDWWIFAISGHCTTCENALNPEYLYSRSSSTLELLHTTMEGYGYTVESFGYADEFYNRDADLNSYYANAWLSGHDGPEPTGSGYPDSWGFLQVVSDMEYIRDNWQADFVDPTQVMFVAHSHGDVWAHQAFRSVEDLDIEVAIDLDGYSSYWAEEAWWTNFGDDWEDVISDYNNRYGTNYPTTADDSWYVAGVGNEDVEDVIPQDNVTYCFEVQASDTWNTSYIWVNDDDDNHRPDGSTTGIYTFDSSDEDHMEVIEPGGDGMNWVLSQLDALYLGSE